VYPLLPGHVRNEQFCTADTAVRKVFTMPRNPARSRRLRGEPPASSPVLGRIAAAITPVTTGAARQDEEGAPAPASSPSPPPGEGDAAALREDAKQKTEEYVARRTSLAEQKIQQAETEAVNEVRASAVELAVAAAEKVMADKIDAKKADDLFKSSLTELKGQLN